MSPSYPQIRLKPGREAILQHGHPWVFSGALQAIPAFEPGTIVEVVSFQGRRMGLGFFHPKGNIVFRLLTHNPNETIDRSFWEKRLLSAIQLRDRLIDPKTNAYRLVNAEGDFIPGLIVDRYDQILVVSFQTWGIERHRETLIDLLTTQCRPLGIYERSESRARRQEGLEDRAGWIYGDKPQTSLVIRENGLLFEVDVAEGQKTGFFLDQRENRLLLKTLSSGLRVLNCFSYTGGFSVYAAAGGATQVVSVETSKPANACAQRNLERNGFSVQTHPLLTEDVFSYLRRSDDRFDLIILDPPAFAKTQKDVERAVRGYEEINTQAMKRLRPGGLLMTFSCSNPIDLPLFRKVLITASQKAGKHAQILKILGTGPDHPVLLPHAEGAYLKGFLLTISE